MLDFLKFSIGDIRGDYFNIEVQNTGDCIHVKWEKAFGTDSGDFDYNGNSLESAFCWLERLDNLEINKWKTKYYNPDDINSIQWRLDYKKIENKNCRHIRGNNFYPENWDEFIDLMDTLGTDYVFKSLREKRRTRILGYQALITDENLTISRMYNTLNRYGDRKKDYSSYFEENDVDFAMQMLDNADYELATAIMTLVLREDYWKNGAWKKRLKDGTVRKVLQRIVDILSEGKTVLKTIMGDITRVTNVQAIVNSANNRLLGGGGETGKAKLTKGYELPCDFVIHTVGPFWNGGMNGEPEQLAACYYNSLKVAMENGIRSIAFPSISTGGCGYPVENAAKTAVGTVCRFLEIFPDKFDLIEWVLLDDRTLKAYEIEIDRMY